MTVFTIMLQTFDTIGKESSIENIIKMINKSELKDMEILSISK